MDTGGVSSEAKGNMTIFTSEGQVPPMLALLASEGVTISPQAAVNIWGGGVEVQLHTTILAALSVGWRGKLHTAQLQSGESRQWVLLDEGVTREALEAVRTLMYSGSVTSAAPLKDILRAAEALDLDHTGSITCSMGQGVTHWEGHGKRLQAALQLMAANGMCCDLEVYASGAVFKAHQLVLGTSCRALHDALVADSSGSISALHLLDTDPGIARLFLSYLYCGKAEVPGELVPALHRLSSTLQVSCLAAGTRHCLTRGPVTMPLREDTDKLVVMNATVSTPVEGVVERLKELYHQGRRADLTLVAGGRKVLAHRAILSAVSPVCHKMLALEQTDGPSVVVAMEDQGVAMAALVDLIYLGHCAVPLALTPLLCSLVDIAAFSLTISMHKGQARHQEQNQAPSSVAVKTPPPLDVTLPPLNTSQSAKVDHTLQDTLLCDWRSESDSEEGKDYGASRPTTEHAIHSRSSRVHGSGHPFPTSVKCQYVDPSTSPQHATSDSAMLNESGEELNAAKRPCHLQNVPERAAPRSPQQEHHTLPEPRTRGHRRKKQHRARHTKLGVAYSSNQTYAQHPYHSPQDPCIPQDLHSPQDPHIFQDFLPPQDFHSPQDSHRPQDPHSPQDPHTPQDCHSHQTELHTCSSCGLGFKEEHALVSHMQQSHSCAVLFLCSTCSQEFPELDELTKHEQACQPCQREEEAMLDPPPTDTTINTTITLKICRFCSQIFSDSESLRQHQQEACGTSQELIVCPDCGEAFNDLSALSIHAFQQGHATVDEPCYICGLCNLAFLEEDKLLQHMGCHTPQILLPGGG